MSAQIRKERAAYYDVLESTQKETLDISNWMEWYLKCLSRAIEGSQTTLRAVLYKARFWETFAKTDLNPRQRSMVNRLLDGFEGKLTTTKWGKITKSSHDTALRDIQYLIKQGILAQSPEGGRSTSYELVKVNEGSAAA
jgi:Fic family protein